MEENRSIEEKYSTKEKYSMEENCSMEENRSMEEKQSMEEKHSKKKDIVIKDYMSDAAVLADAFNYYIYGGEQVIQPEQLTERDSTEIALPYGADGAAVPVQRFRDVRKLYTAMTDGKAEYVLYGVENQSEIHYAMAVKNCLYDALDYAGQVEEAARSHRRAMKEARRLRQNGSTGSFVSKAEENVGIVSKAEENDSIVSKAEQNSSAVLKAEPEGGMHPEKKPNAGEFLSGFWKEDRLIPSVTLTVYFGCEEWDGPLSLFEMMDVTDQKVLSCMDDYHVRLIAPALMTDEEIMKFQSSLREVMLYIKHSKDKEALNRIVNGNRERFQRVERRAVDVINVITGTGLKYEESEVEVDVCKAILDMRLESEQIGEQRGEQKGELKKARESAERFYQMGISVEKVAEGVGYDVNIVKEWLNLPV